MIIDIGDNRRVHLHTAPNSHSATLDYLNYGLHVKILGYANKYTKVKLPNGDIGYVFTKYTS